MGRDYKDIVRQLWRDIPSQLADAERDLLNAFGRYLDAEEQWIIADTMAVLGITVANGRLISFEYKKAVEDFKAAQRRYQKYSEMMQVLQDAEFIDIVFKYFDGFFKLDGEIE